MNAKQPTDDEWKRLEELQSIWLQAQVGFDPPTNAEIDELRKLETLATQWKSAKKEHSEAISNIEIAAIVFIVAVAGCVRVVLSAFTNSTDDPANSAVLLILVPLLPIVYLSARWALKHRKRL